ncbi:hypothetical protein QF042_002955 [Pedobacter sp. W3I1]|nr:hypothetical protein [Pedobacter sp. W3I1]
MYIKSIVLVGKTILSYHALQTFNKIYDFDNFSTSGNDGIKIYRYKNYAIHKTFCRIPEQRWPVRPGG